MINLKQNADGSLSFIDESTGLTVWNIGGNPATQSIPAFRSPIGVEYNVLGGVDTPGGLVSAANPFGRAFYITSTLLAVTTQSSGGNTVSGGCAATGTTSNATLISSQSVATAGMFGGALLANAQIWTPALFLTLSTVTGASAGLVGKLIVTGHLL